MQNLKLKETEIIRPILSNKYNTNYKSTINAISSLSSEGFDKLDPYQQLEVQNFFNIQDKINTIFVSAFKTFQDLHKYPFETTLLEDNSDYRKWLITQSKEIKKKLFVVQKAETLSKLLKSKIENKDFAFKCSNTFTLDIINIIILAINHGLVKEGIWINQAIKRDQSTRRKGKHDALSRVFDEEYVYLSSKLGRIPSFREVLDRLKYISDGDEHNIIVSVNEEYICWISSRDKKIDTAIESLRSRYTKVKKRFKAYK